MLRYIIFAGRTDDGGNEGWRSVLRDENNQILSFNNADEAIAKLPKTSGFDGYDWSHVVDIHTGQIVVSR